MSVQRVSVDATCRSVGKRAETYTNQELSVLSTRDVNNWHYVSSVVQEGFPDYAPSFGSSGMDTVAYKLAMLTSTHQLDTQATQLAMPLPTMPSFPAILAVLVIVTH